MLCGVLRVSMFVLLTVDRVCQYVSWVSVSLIHCVMVCVVVLLFVMLLFVMLLSVIAIDFFAYLCCMKHAILQSLNNLKTGIKYIKVFIFWYMDINDLYKMAIESLKQFYDDSTIIIITVYNGGVMSPHSVSSGAKYIYTYPKPCYTLS